MEAVVEGGGRNEVALSILHHCQAIRGAIRVKDGLVHTFLHLY